MTVNRLLDPEFTCVNCGNKFLRAATAHAASELNQVGRYVKSAAACAWVGAEFSASEY
jgi:hypothetical protein